MHLGQNKGKFFNSVSSRILLRVLLPQTGQTTLPFMDAGLRELAKRTLSKVDALTEAEYRELAVYPADEV